MPTMGDSDAIVATSTTTVTCPQPTGLADGDWWMITTLWRGSISVATPPPATAGALDGFVEFPDAGGSTGATASNIKATTWGMYIEDAADPDVPASVNVVGTGNVFGVGFSYRVSGADPTSPVDDAVFASEVDNDADVTSPAADATVGGTLVVRIAAMNNSGGFALNDFTPTDATRVESPAMTAGTSRVSGGLAHEAGPGAAGTTGTELWAVGGASFGAAAGLSVVFKGATFAVDAGDDQDVVPGEMVELDFTASTPGAASYAVELTSGTYPAQHIVTVEPGVIRFVAPTGPATLEFTLTAGDGTLEGTDTVTVNVSAGSGGGLRVGVLDATGHAVYT